MSEDAENPERSLTDSQQVENTSNLLSRRSFIKLTAALGVSATLENSTPGRIVRKLNKKERSGSPDRLVKTKVAVIDFFEFKEVKPRFLKELFPLEFSPKEEFEKMGVSDPDSIQGLMSANPENDDQARLLLLNILGLAYSSHGDNVVGVYDKTERKLGHTAQTPVRIDLVEAVEIEKEVKYDDLGNPALEFRINHDKVAEMVRQSGADVVNMSFQPGRNSITFEMYGERTINPVPLINVYTIDGITTYKDEMGNILTEEEVQKIREAPPETEVFLFDPIDRNLTYEDGYAGEHTEENLNALHQIAARFPEKTFVAAGGNEFSGQIPDFRQTR